MADPQWAREAYPYPSAGGGPSCPWWYRVAARVRGASWAGGWLAIAAGILGRLPPVDSAAALDVLYLGLFLVLVAALLDGGLPTPRIAPRPVGSPVRGRWRAHNSPANRVPSHRIHSFAQTFAIDLAYRPERGARPQGKARAFRPPEDFPGFGQEIVAPAAARVVAVRDGARDHRSRSSPEALRLMRLEGFLRGLAGPRFLTGNLIVLDVGGGVYAALAHLERRSAAVRRGEVVHEGQVLARCGNSGNSSEPHLHFQLMDHPRMLLAAGLPFVFTGLTAAAPEAQGHLPRNGEVIVAASEQPSRKRSLV